MKGVAALALALLLAAPRTARPQADAIERAWDALDAAPVAEVEERREELLALSPREDVALAGLRRAGVSIGAPQVVAKSYPGFWEDFGSCLSR